MKRLSLLTAAALLLTGCVPSVSHVATTAYEDKSIPEVTEALSDPAMLQVVEDTRAELLDSSELYGTPVEFERDVLVCEQLHEVEAELGMPWYFDDPDAVALSECVNATISAYGLTE